MLTVNCVYFQLNRKFKLKFNLAKFSERVDQMQHLRKNGPNDGATKSKQRMLSKTINCSEKLTGK